MQTIVSLLKALGKFVYQLLFTRDDDLDLLQILFVMIVAVAAYLSFYVVVLTAAQESIILEAFSTLRWMLGLLIVTAVPKWLVPAIVSILTKKSDDDHH